MEQNPLNSLTGRYGGDSLNLCKASINYALSNHFLLYLQQAGYLQPLIKAYKQRPNPGSAAQMQAHDDIVILQKLMADSFDNIQQKFNTWFINKYRFSLFTEEPVNEEVAVGLMSFDELEKITNGILDELKTKPQLDKKYSKLNKEFKSIVKKYRKLEIQYFNSPEAKQESLKANASIPQAQQIRAAGSENKYSAKMKDLKQQLLQLKNNIETILRQLATQRKLAD